MSAEEALVLARIGEVIDSSPEVGLAYESFMWEVGCLVNFEEIGITVRTADDCVIPEYVGGEFVPGWKDGFRTAFPGSLEERI